MAGDDRGDFDAFLQGLVDETSTKLGAQSVVCMDPLVEASLRMEEEGRARKEAALARLAAMDSQLAKSADVESLWAERVRQRKEAEREKKAAELARQKHVSPAATPPESPKTAARRAWAEEAQKRVAAQQRLEANRRDIESKILHAEWAQQLALNRERLRKEKQAPTQPSEAGTEPTSYGPSEAAADTDVASCERKKNTFLVADRPDRAALRHALELAEKETRRRQERTHAEAEQELWDAMLARNRYAKKQERELQKTPRAMPRWGLLST